MFKSDSVNLILKMSGTWILYLLVTYTIFEDLKQDTFFLGLFIIMSIVVIITTVRRVIKIINLKSDRQAC